MGEISNNLNKLQLAVREKKPSLEIEALLTSLKKDFLHEGSDKKKNVEQMVKGRVVETFSSILNGGVLYSTIAHALVAEILAEITKIDAGRTCCSNSDLIKPLLELLSSDDANVVLQACRALGNLCYDNDTARSLVKNYDGVDCFMKLLKSLLLKDNLPENMRTIASGCLLNLTDTYEEIQDQAVKAGILDVLLEYLLKFSTDEDVVTHCLLVLSCLADSSYGRSKILEKPVLTDLLNLLEKPLNDDIMDSLLELFGNLCENDDAKLSLASMGLCEKLVDIVNKHLNSGSIVNGTFNICKTVPDLIILILTGDKSMEHLWYNGEGRVYKEAQKWLKSNDENLLIAGALAAGNFARKDSHCIRMLDDGIVEVLKLLLEKHSGGDGDIRMQHAVLSALRNLAIPSQNKAAMVDLGIDDKLIDMMNVETFPVVFKLLGTLRMLLDNQERVAIKVGGNKSFVERLVGWCNVDDHPGVKGEATRLLAWLPKNSMDKRVLENLVKAKALPPIIAMLKSEHDVMKKEALVAVKLVANNCLSYYSKDPACNASSEDLETITSSTNLIQQLQELLKSHSSPEILEQILTLLIILSKSEKLKLKIAAAIATDLDSLKDHSDEKIKELAREILEGCGTVP